MSIVEMKLEHRRAIAKHAEAAFPQECRGLLLGTRDGITKQVKDVVYLNGPSNTATEPGTFQVSEGELQEGEEMARAKGLEFLGVFLSRTDRPAKPLGEERPVAQPALSYVMVGVRDGRAHELTAWKLYDGGNSFYQEDIRGA
jgi:proteasome lid subunit RPN8/RPN11